MVEVVAVCARALRRPNDSTLGSWRGSIHNIPTISLRLAVFYLVEAEEYLKRL